MAFITSDVSVWLNLQTITGLDDDVTKFDVFIRSLKEGKHSEKSKYTESERECAKYSTTWNAKIILMLKESHLNVRPVVKAICIEVICLLITVYI